MLDYLQSLPGAASQGLIWAIMAIGVFITYKVLNVADLTVDGSFATGGIVAGVLITNGVHFALALVIAFLAGLICGFLTGILHTLLGIPDILAGILTQMALWSVNLLVNSGRGDLSISHRAYHLFFSQSNPLDALWKIAIIVAVVAGILYLFFGTELGASIRATGNNKDMAKAQGINTKFNIVLGLMISNGLVALSGALLAQYQGYTGVTAGQGAIVTGLCAVIIGTAIVKKISPNFLVRMIGVAFGAVIYWIIYQTVSFVGIDTNLLKMLAAVIVIVFLGIPYIKKTYGDKIKKHFKNRKLANRGDNVW